MPSEEKLLIVKVDADGARTDLGEVRLTEGDRATHIERMYRVVLETVLNAVDAGDKARLDEAVFYARHFLKTTT